MHGAALRTARMASRSCSVLATRAAGTSGCTRKWRARASRIGGVTPWRASSYEGAAASLSVTTSIYGWMWSGKFSALRSTRLSPQHLRCDALLPDCQPLAALRYTPPAIL
jgi:hypothetical protein